MKIPCSFLILFFLAISGIVSLAQEKPPRGELRTLTPKAEGKRPVEVLIVRVNEGNVTFLLPGSDKEFTYPVTAFSDADQKHLDGWTVPPPPPHVPSVNEHGIKDGPGLAEYQQTETPTHDEGRWWIYVPETYHPDIPMPLVVNSHGNYNLQTKGAHPGSRAINAWKKYADEYGFIVVCPSFDVCCTPGGDFASQQNTRSWDLSHAFVEKLMPKLFDTFSIDREKVMMTGSSGGGHTTLLAMDFPDYFSSLCFRIPNCSNSYIESIDRKNFRKWEGRPVYYFHGQNDTLIPADDEQISRAKELLREHVGGDRLLIETLDIAHDSKPQYAAEWFVSEVMGKELSSETAKDVLKSERPEAK